MALQGINLPLAHTGVQLVLQLHSNPLQLLLLCMFPGPSLAG